MNNNNHKSVAIILLNYNSFDYTEACVRSLKEIAYQNYKIVIVDNCSTDDSLSKLAKFESEMIHIIKSPQNGGFAFGNNIGIKYAINNGFSYVLLLNNDTVVERNFLNLLISSAEKEESDITTCRIMYNSDRNRIWYAGGEMDWFNQRSIHTGINSFYKTDTINKTRTVSFISGCCMLISERCIREIGYLPEEYFMYYEDAAYCQKAIDNDLKLLYEPESVIYHCVSASGGGQNSPFVIEWRNRSRRRFMKKYGQKMNKLERIISSFVCESREIARIIISRRLLKGLIAYIKSFTAAEQTV